MIPENYINTVKHLKEQILSSRYRVAKLANKEMLFLYYEVGKIISEKVATEKWGSKTVEKLSADLQNELNGLRGFSFENLKKMRRFYDEWSLYFIENSLQISISSTLSNQFVENFIKVGFSAHYEIITKVKSLDARIFYITKSAQEFWAVRTLRHYLKNNLYNSQATLPNNFDTTLTKSNKEKALKSFRDHYLLDYILISEDDEDDERVLETGIVQNIKKFIMSLGSDFSFIGNQYRLIVEEDEYFIDLLFFNRTLQALVAIELKAGKFKPEYLGKMNFYLSALDEYVKKKHENPSIGIILCKEKKNKTVEFAFRDFNKAMGVQANCI